MTSTSVGTLHGGTAFLFADLLKRQITFLMSTVASWRTFWSSTPSASHVSHSSGAHASFRTWSPNLLFFAHLRLFETRPDTGGGCRHWLFVGRPHRGSSASELHAPPFSNVCVSSTTFPAARFEKAQCRAGATEVSSSRLHCATAVVRRRRLSAKIFSVPARLFSSSRGLHVCALRNVEAPPIAMLSSRLPSDWQVPSPPCAFRSFLSFFETCFVDLP